MATLPEIPEAVRLEHSIAELMTAQETVGWPFDVRKAQELENKLLTKLEGLRECARGVCTFAPGNLFTPKRDNKTQGYVAGAEMQRLKEFNPSSRDHIAWYFKTFQNWEFTKLTETGKPVIDETVLKDIGTEEASVFLSILETQKKLGMLSQGNNAWLKLVKNGRLHHSCFIGAATHRMAHARPNLAQVSSDADCRELFITKPGWKLVDSDLAGIELRIFAHYLARYDGVRFGHRAKMAEGDGITEMYEKTRAEGFGAEVQRRVMVGTYVLSAGFYDAYYNRARRVRALIKKDFDDVFAAGVDAILTPATPSSAFELGKEVADPVEMYLNDVFTVTVNLAGLPGISIPAGLDASGLPLGLQLIGRPWEEGDLLNTAYALENAVGFNAKPNAWW